MPLSVEALDCAPALQGLPSPSIKRVMANISKVCVCKTMCSMYQTPYELPPTFPLNFAGHKLHPIISAGT